MELLGDCDEAIAECEMKMVRTKDSQTNATIMLRFCMECGCTSIEAAEYLYQYAKMGYTAKEILESLKRIQAEANLPFNPT